MRMATLLLLLAGQIAMAQPVTPVMERVNAARSKGKAYAAPGLLKRLGDPEPHMQRVLKRGSLLSLDKKAMQELKANRPDFVVLDLPLEAGHTLTLELVKSEVLAPDFKLSTSAPTSEEYKPERSVFYQGIVRGPARSVAAISVVGDEVIGVMQVDGIGNLILGALENDPQGRYAFFRSEDLQHDMKFECGTDELPASVQEISDQVTVMNSDPGKCVRIYFECEYDMYLSNGSSVTNTVNMMTGIYNVVKTLYDNENVNTTISEIFVWTTPDDYPTTSTSDALNAFRTRRGTSFNGNLAHLVSRGSPTGGGIAYLNVTCNKSFAYAYSFINQTYSQFPTYSWTVMVIAHEMGHNLGSPHTHNCSWDVNGDGVASEMIDGCGPSRGYSEGSCPVAPLPTNGGTIMSYCHLVSGVGINLNQGFGLLPGNRIRDRVYNGTCLTACSTCSTTVSVTSNPVTCPGGNNGSASVVAGGGTPPYTYQWSTGATTASISGLAAGTYTVTVRDQNGTGCATTASVTIAAPTAWNVTSVVIPASVQGANDGSIDITVSGATPPYTYTWSNNATTQDLVNIPGGNYSVTIRDSRGCTTVRNFTVGSNGCGQQITTFPVNESFETGPGIFTQATNDNYDWIRQSGTTPNNRTGPSGAYQGTWYMFAQGKGNTGNAILESPCLKLDNLTNPTVQFAYSMNGSQIGTLRLEVSTNNGATWTTLWTRSGDQGANWLIASASLNAYKTAFTKIRFLAVAGGNFGDIAIDGIQIQGQPTNPCTGPVLSFTKTDVSCFGGTNGSATVTPSNGNGPYTYAWSDGSSSSSIQNKASGNYSVTVTGSDGCTATGSVIIGQPSQPLQLSLQPTATSGPGASDGSVTLTVSGGTPGYSFAWSNGAGSQNIQGLTAGTYSVTVQDANNCTAQASANVEDGDGPGGCTNGITLPHTESFENGHVHWVQSAADQFDWRRNSGSTPTGNTGPTGAADGQFYMYTEANDASSGARAILESSCLDLTNISNANFQFSWHMFGNQMGSMALEITDNNGATWTPLWGRSGNFGNSWVNESLSLSVYAGKVVRFRFVGTLSNGVRGDMAIDHIRINAGAAVPQLITAADGSRFQWDRVYPNPTSGRVQLEIYVPENTMARVSMLDATGRVSDIGPMSLSSGMNTMNINLPTRQPGMYLLRLQENGRVHTKQIILMK